MSRRLFVIVLALACAGSGAIAARPSAPPAEPLEIMPDGTRVVKTPHGHVTLRLDVGKADAGGRAARCVLVGFLDESRNPLAVQELRAYVEFVHGDRVKKRDMHPLERPDGESEYRAAVPDGIWGRSEILVRADVNGQGFSARFPMNIPAPDSSRAAVGETDRVGAEARGADSER